jgi:type II secretory pathway pseudopilin PulG
MSRSQGYVLIMLVLLMTVLSIGLMVAVPVWQTQIQREKEEELIFRGKQYVEAVRIYQLKNPGRFPKTLDELVEKRCIRRLYRDPMSSHGEWNIILHKEAGGRMPQSRPTAQARDRGVPGERRPAGQPQAFSPQKVLVAPLQALGSIQNPQILGVVSSSTRKSIKIYNDQTSYDKWLFFYGQDPNKLPEITIFGQASKLP